MLYFLPSGAVCAKFAHTESLSNSFSLNIFCKCFVMTERSTENSSDMEKSNVKSIVPHSQGVLSIKMKW